MAPKAKAAAKSPGKAVKVTKEKKEKKEKDPNAPKRPLSAYFLFGADHRVVLKKSQPTLTMGEVGKATGAAWKEMSDKEKEPYVKKYEAAKAKFDKEMAAYKK